MLPTLWHRLVIGRSGTEVVQCCGTVKTVKKGCPTFLVLVSGQSSLHINASFDASVAISIHSEAKDAIACRNPTRQIFQVFCASGEGSYCQWVGSVCPSPISCELMLPVTDPAGRPRCCCCLQGCCSLTGCDWWLVLAGLRLLWSAVLPGNNQSPWSSHGSPAHHRGEGKRLIRTGPEQMFVSTGLCSFVILSFSFFALICFFKARGFLITTFCGQ